LPYVIIFQEMFSAYVICCTGTFYNKSCREKLAYLHRTNHYEVPKIEMMNRVTGGIDSTRSYSHSVRLDHGIGIGIDIGKEIGIGDMGLFILFPIVSLFYP
jgi:hypothetical protein